MVDTRKTLAQISESQNHDAARLALAWINGDDKAGVVNQVLDLPPSEMITLGFAFSRLKGGPAAMGELCDAIEQLGPQDRRSDMNPPEDPGHPPDLATRPPPASEFR